MRQSEAGFVGRYLAWLRDDAMPYWAENGLNRKAGFHERLFHDGKPDTDCPHRVRVQARQIFAFSCASYRGWLDQAAAVSDFGWNFLTSKGSQSATGDVPGIAYTLNWDGTLHDPYRDLYTQAFAIHTAAWRVKAFGDSSAQQYLYAMLAFLDTEFRASNAGWIEGIPARIPRRQNPHMHLFEAFMTAYEATGDQVILRTVEEILVLFRKYFFDEKKRVVREFFEEDWAVCSEMGHIVEPGHMLAWCWLLRWYENVGTMEVSDYADALFESAIRIGENAATGLLFDAVDDAGTPLKRTSRLWSATEYLKAAIVQEKSIRTEVSGKVARMLFDYYLDTPIRGTWYDQVDDTGQVISEFFEASTLYHLVGAADVVAATLEEAADA